MDLNFDSETSFQQSSALQLVQPAQSSLSTGAQPTSSSAHLDNLPPPLFDAFHQLPHGDFKPQFFNPFEVKHRRRTSRAQFKMLEKTFMDNPKPNATVRRALALKLNMTARGVQVWFQNRRAKAKLLRDVTDRRSSFDSTNGSCSEPEPDFQIEDVVEHEDEDRHQLNVSTKGEDINTLESLPNALIGNDPSSGTYPDYQDNLVGSRIESSIAKATDMSSCSHNIQHVTQSAAAKKHSVRASSDQLEIAHDAELQVMAEQRQREVYAQREQHNLKQQRPVNSLAMRNSWSGSQFSSLIQPNSTAELHRSSYNIRPDVYESLINPLVASSSTISLPDTLPAYERSYNSTISSTTMMDENGQLSIGNSNDAVSSNVALGRRNSCPADFIQNFWSVQLDDKPSPGLPTIAEDEIACPPQNEHQYLAAHQMMGRRMSEPNNRNTYSYSAPRYREQQFAEVTPIITAQTSYGLDPTDYSSQRSHNLAQTSANYHMAPQLMRGHSLDSFIWSMQQQQKATPIATASFARDHFNSFRGSDEGHSTVESYHEDQFSDATSVQPVPMVDPLEFTYAPHAQAPQSTANISQVNGSSASMMRLQRRGSYPLQYVNYVTQPTTDNSSNPLAV